MSRALVILAEGAEEIETVTTVDVLRRGGVQVTLCGLGGSEPIKCSRNVVVTPDKSIDEAMLSVPYDAVILPGGPGHTLLAESSKVKELLVAQESSGKVIGAICAAPVVLLAHGICLGRKLTSYPAVKDKLVDKYQYTESRVEVDGSLVTSRGPGTTIEFALKLIEVLEGPDVAKQTATAMII